MDKNIAALLREDARTVKVQFTATPYEMRRALANGEQLNPGQNHTYIVDFEVLAGDYILVPTNNSPVPKVAMVVAVDDGVDIQPNSDIKYKWAYNRVDLSTWQANERRNEVIEATVSEAYKNNLRRSFAQQILSGVDESQRLQLESLLKAGQPPAALSS